MSSAEKSAISCPIIEEFRHASTGRFDALHYSLRLPSLKTFEAFWHVASSIYGLSEDVPLNFLNLNWHDINIVPHIPNVEEIREDDSKSFDNLVGYRTLSADILENKASKARIFLMQSEPTDESPCICCDIRDLQDLMFDIVDIKQPENQDELRKYIGTAKALSERAVLQLDNPNFRMY